MVSLQPPGLGPESSVLDILRLLQGRQQALWRCPGASLDRGGRVEPRAWGGECEWRGLGLGITESLGLCGVLSWCRSEQAGSPIECPGDSGAAAGPSRCLPLGLCAHWLPCCEDMGLGALPACPALCVPQLPRGTIPQAPPKLGRARLPALRAILSQPKPSSHLPASALPASVRNMKESIKLGSALNPAPGGSCHPLGCSQPPYSCGPRSHKSKAPSCHISWYQLGSSLQNCHTQAPSGAGTWLVALGATSKCGPVATQHPFLGLPILCWHPAPSGFFPPGWLRCCQGTP